MPAVLKNIDLKGAIDDQNSLSRVAVHRMCIPVGSTMGSQTELEEATRFISKHKIAPHVSHVLEGLAAADKGFELLEEGSSMGKIVVRIAPKDSKL